MTQEQRSKLFKVAKELGSLWWSLPDDEAKGDEYRYRGGVVQLTFKGGFTDGWVDLSWNEVVTDIYAGKKFSFVSKPYETVLNDTREKSVPQG